MNELLELLTGGDLRSEGRAAEVASRVIGEPDRLVLLLEGLSLDDRLVRARTCMALEVMSRTHAARLGPHVDRFLDAAERETVAQARWHLAEVLANVTLGRRPARRAVDALLDYLSDRSKIVRVCAVRALGVLGRPAGRAAEVADAIRGHAEDSRGLGKAVAAALRILEDAG